MTSQMMVLIRVIPKKIDPNNKAAAARQVLRNINKKSGQVWNFSYLPVFCARFPGCFPDKAAAVFLFFQTITSCTRTQPQ